tara:strand:- start:2713 stop:3357 length:645 start_codon:yes stop_codon:yes gene_type:complete
MKKGTSITILVSSLAVLGIVGFLVYRKKNGKSKFKRKAVKVAKEEWKIWNTPSAWNENSPVRYKDLKRYWDSVDWREGKWSPTGTAWSAAFMSYVVKQAGAGDDFNYSSSHSRYIREAIKNRKENSKNKFKGYRLDEVPVEIGDLVCYSREPETDLYNRTSSYMSHCDIVTRMDKNYVEVIGGNVSNGVTKKSVPVKNRIVQEGGKRFVVIKTK